MFIDEKSWLKQQVLQVELTSSQQTIDKFARVSRTVMVKYQGDTARQKSARDILICGQKPKECEVVWRKLDG